jgi:hypothetical protein
MVGVSVENSQIGDSGGYIFNIIQGRFTGFRRVFTEDMYYSIKINQICLKMIIRGLLLYQIEK